MIPTPAQIAARVAELEQALRPFVNATLTDHGHIIGLMREDFDRARAALSAQGADGLKE